MSGRAAADRGDSPDLATPRLAAHAWAPEARAALSLLTRLPVRAPADGRTGSAAFALIGAGLGAVAAVPALLLAGVAPLPGAFLALAAIEVLTGALHLDGLADTADALAAPDAARAEAARKDPQVGSAGAGAIVLVLGLAVGSLAAIAGWAVAGALVVAGATSRAVPAIWVPLGASSRSRATRHGTVLVRAGEPSPAGFGAWFASRSGSGGAAAAVLTCALAVALAAAIGLTVHAAGPAEAIIGPVSGALVGAACGLAVLAALGRRFGSIVGDHYGAAVEIAFAAALAAQAVALGLARS